MNKFAIAILAVSCFTLTACGEEAAYGTAYTNSQSAWLTAKSQNGNAYLYRVESKGENGDGALTSLTITDGAVTQRGFKHYDDLGFRTGVTAEWTEELSDVGLHDEGAAAVTIDDLYETCQGTILNQGPDANIVFTVDERGVLQTCTYRPASCNADACAVGVKIYDLIFMSEMGR